MADNKLDRFKKTIKFLETTNGTNLNHRRNSAGERAGGAYGIIPSSLSDFINQTYNREMPVDTRLLDIANKPPDEVTEILNKDREIDEAAGDLGANLLLNKTGGDEEQAAYGWRLGHNRDFENLDPSVYQNLDYIKAYNKKSKEFPDSTPAPRAFKKVKNILN